MSSSAESYMFAGLELGSPIINAAGSINGTSIDNIKKEVSSLANSGIGAIRLGSFTVPKRQGNVAEFGEPVLIIDVEQGKTWNSMGLPNIGQDNAVKIASEIVNIGHDAGKPVIYSGSPTSMENMSSVEQAAVLAEKFLDTPVDLVELNVSCPNVVTEGGGRKPIMGYDLETMEELVDELGRRVGVDQRLGVKVPPYLSDEELAIVPDLAKLFRTKKIFRFIVTCNTIPNQMPVYPDGTDRPLSVGRGGLSGPSTYSVGRYQLALWLDQTHGEIDIDSCQGVDDGYELAQRMEIGAKVGSGVTFLWRSSMLGMNWSEAITDVLGGYATELEHKAAES